MPRTWHTAETQKCCSFSPPLPHWHRCNTRAVGKQRGLRSKGCARGSSEEKWLGIQTPGPAASEDQTLSVLPGSDASATATLDEQGQTDLEGGRSSCHAIRFPVVCGFSSEKRRFMQHQPNPATSTAQAGPSG